MCVALYIFPFVKKICFTKWSEVDSSVVGLWLSVALRRGCFTSPSLGVTDDAGEPQWWLYLDPVGYTVERVTEIIDPEAESPAETEFGPDGHVVQPAVGAGRTADDE